MFYLYCHTTWCVCVFMVSYQATMSGQRPTCLQILVHGSPIYIVYYISYYGGNVLGAVIMCPGRVTWSQHLASLTSMPNCLPNLSRFIDSGCLLLSFGYFFIWFTGLVCACVTLSNMALLYPNLIWYVYVVSTIPYSQLFNLYIH